jgi:hypothetical protein
MEVRLLSYPVLFEEWLLVIVGRSRSASDQGMTRRHELLSGEVTAFSTLLVGEGTTSFDTLEWRQGRVALAT